MLVLQAGLLVNCVLPKSSIHWSHSRSLATRISRQQNVESEVQADQPTIMEQEYGEAAAAAGPAPSSSTSSPSSSAGDNNSKASFTTESKASFSASIDKNIKKAVLKTAATFAPRASAPQKNKNPAVPGTALYTVFELQGYASMLLGGALSYNLIFPSNEPDIWRLMGMWSIWMFTIPSLRARDCSKEEKETLNYLFLLIPLINVILPFFWKSFSLVWSADTFAFFSMYAWKMRWLQKTE